MKKEAPTPSRVQHLWMMLRADREFRSTFLGAIVLPTACCVVVVVWILRAVRRGG